MILNNFMVFKMSVLKKWFLPLISILFEYGFLVVVFWYGARSW